MPGDVETDLPLQIRRRHDHRLVLRSDTEPPVRVVVVPDRMENYACLFCMAWHETVQDYVWKMLVVLPHQNTIKIYLMVNVVEL